VFTPAGSIKAAGAFARGLRGWRANPGMAELRRQLPWMLPGGVVLVLLAWVLELLT
jgi:hypothetical protein